MPGPQGPHKILVIGEPGIGKTSLIRRYVDNQFDKNYTATLAPSPSSSSTQTITDVSQPLRLILRGAGQPASSSTDQVEPLVVPPPPQPLVLVLRPRRRNTVKWSEATVDNEHLGRKKSKRC